MHKSAAPSIFPNATWLFEALLLPRPSRLRPARVDAVQHPREAVVPAAARARMGVRARRLLRAND